ncbi:MAG: aminoacyl-tRNA hydrolase [Chitinophagaceae bacterium]|nr:aminoacyl-tRNA hydrolase [Chitinophagaceae bacterium]MCB0740701.1 aminoacyl-tRNA hydrolase [Chitinophagaceae bacterium]HQU55776.1 aminoacyl-tRNA hydrolase [Chitinophagaceae bacterium]HQV05430.1 aminoacyl-tRNA hydrolase [Chitinophagaceae bacterium]
MKFLIAGLGNPGNEYAHTRHNIGFDVVHHFVQKHKGAFEVDRLAFRAKVKWKGKSFICICPSTYMNLSGKAIKYWMNKEKISREHLLVVVDDLALPLEKLRLKPAGSDAGHNGLKSIEEELQTRNYARLRFGIGNDFAKGYQSDFVLGKWTSTEAKLVALKIEKSVEAIEVFAFNGLQTAMNSINNQVYSL